MEEHIYSFDQFRWTFSSFLSTVGIDHFYFPKHIYHKYQTFQLLALTIFKIKQKRMRRISSPYSHSRTETLCSSFRHKTQMNELKKSNTHTPLMKSNNNNNNWNTFFKSVTLKFLKQQNLLITTTKIEINTKHITHYVMNDKETTTLWYQIYWVNQI